MSRKALIPDGRVVIKVLMIVNAATAVAGSMGFLLID
jgi:hypothetical protein